MRPLGSKKRRTIRCQGCGNFNYQNPCPDAPIQNKGGRAFENRGVIEQQSHPNDKENNMITSFYAVSKNQDGQYQILGGPYTSKDGAMSGGEMAILNTWGNKHSQYSKLINNLKAFSESEAKYFKLV